MKLRPRKLYLFLSSGLALTLTAGSALNIHAGSVNHALDFFASLNSERRGASFAWGEHSLNRIIDTQTTLIRHTATKLQRQIAEQNARKYVAQLAPEKRTQLKKKNVRYLAVPTVRSKETSPAAKEVLMIWDIPREAVVGKNAYELTSTPPIGELASYDNVVAEYVGEPLYGGSRSAASSRPELAEAIRRRALSKVSP